MSYHSPGVRCGICVVILCLAILTALKAQSAGPAKATPEHPRFVREFASAQDIARPHPLRDQVLDIVAGPKADEIPADVLQMPYAVTSEAGGRVFVTDLSAKDVHIFDFGQWRYFRLQSGDRLRRPVGVAADAEGNVYVTDRDSAAVLVFDASGKFRRYLKKSRGRESYFEGPWGIAVDSATGRIYVCDSPRHMVIVMDEQGHVLDHFGKRGGGSQPGEFRYPTQIVATRGELIVLDSGNSRVQVLDNHGNFRREIPLEYADDRSGLALDDAGNIYVSDAMLNQVRVFDHDGRLLYSFGQMGSRAGEFNGASGLWMDSGHCLYIADTQNKRIQEFQVAGQSAAGCQ